MKLFKVLLLSFIVVSCNGFYDLQPGVPAGLTASGESDDETDRITLDWSAPVNGSFYSVYRSATVDGTYDELGITNQLQFVDPDILQDTSYFYKVSAWDFTGDNESALSDSVEGITHLYAWDAETESVTSNGSEPAMEMANGILYIYYLDSSNNITIKTYNPDPDEDADETIWDTPVVSPGVVVAGGVWKVLRSGGTYSVLFESAEDTLTFKTYNDDEDIETWEERGDLSTDLSGITDLIQVDFISNGGTEYISFLNDDSSNQKISVYSLNDTDLSWNIIDAAFGTNISEFVLDAYSGDISVAYIDGANLFVQAFGDTSWIDIGGSANINDVDSNLVYEPDGLYVLYEDTNPAVSIKQYSNDAWSSFTSPSVTGNISSAGLEWISDSDNHLHLIVDDGTDIIHKKWVPEDPDIEESVAEWKTLDAAALTGGLSNINAVNDGKEIYLIYQDGTDIEFVHYK